MKTWDDYKDYVKSIDPEAKKDIEEIEAITSEKFSDVVNKDCFKEDCHGV